MKAIQKIKKSLKTTKKVLRGIFGAYERDRRSASPVTTGASDSVSEKHLLGGIAFVLRHGILSLYSYIRKFVPWRSRTYAEYAHKSNSTSSATSSSSLNSISSYIRNLRTIRTAGLTSAFLLGLLALAIIIPLYNVSGTEDTEAATGTAIDSSITFTSTRSTASVAFNPTSTSGTFASSTAGASDAAFSLSTTNSQGYTLKLKSSNGTALKTSTSATDTATLSTIATSTGIESGSFTTNTWGYLPSYYNSSANTTKYYPATTTDITLRTTSSANTTNTSDSYTIGIGAKADLTREAGTYTLGGNSSAMVLSYAVNPTAYEISYKDNSGDSTVANMPTTTQSGSVSATSIALAPNRTPTRTGYNLTGWCLGEVTSAGTSCSGTTIATNGSLALDRTTSNSATLYAVWTPNEYTCTKQYRLQNADGSWGDYTTDTTEQVAFGSTCSYSKTVTNYKGSENGTNGSAATTSATMNSTSGITLQVSLYRNTYTLTVTAGSNTSSATGGGTYRWGQTVTVGVTKASNTTCISYATPTWSRTSGSGTLNATSGTSVTFTMTTSAATVTATSSSSNIAQTVTLSRGTGVSSIKIGSTSYTASSVSLTCGSYTVSGNYSSGYKFSSWARANGVTLSSTTAASTTMTVSGAGKLTLNGTPNTYSLAITFAGSGVSSVQIRTASGTGGTLMGTVSSSGGSVSGLTYNTAYYLYPAFSSGYEFSSWASTGSYGTLSSTSTSNPTFTMGAGNGAVTITGKSSCTAISGTMQAFAPTSTTCESGTLTDSRDSASYIVAKLADGKWWMLDNLRLGSTSTISLSSSNTNLPSDVTWTLPASGTVCFTDSSCTGTNGTTGTGYTVPAINTALKDTVASKKYGSGSGKIGVYYNYCAASAGNICVASNSNNGSADRDICPKGWRIPTSGSSGEYNALYTNSAIGSNANFRTALSTPLSGYFNNGSAGGQGTFGGFWSSTRYDNSNMYALFVYSSKVVPASYNNRFYGYSVRCVLK